MQTPEQGFDHLVAVKKKAEKFDQFRKMASTFATQILRENGALVISRQGQYGGDTRIGSSNSGTRFTQATLPVKIGKGRIVALRDGQEQNSDSIELIGLKSMDELKLAGEYKLHEGPKDALRLLAKFTPSGRVSIPGIPALTNNDDGAETLPI